jgi:hypothetical protein
MPKVIAHRRDAKGAEKNSLYKKSLRALRLCGDHLKITEFLNFRHFRSFLSASGGLAHLKTGTP